MCYDFEVDTGASDNFIRESTWNLLGKPKLQSTRQTFQSATLDDIPILGTATLDSSLNYNKRKLLHYLILIYLEDLLYIF